MAATPKNTFLDADTSKNALAAGICGIVLSGFFFGCRVASRRIKKTPLGSSDYTLGLGMICGWGISAIIIYATTQGLGRHIKALALEDPTLAGPRRIQQGLIAIECLYVVSLGSIKISFLLLYRAIFPGKGFRILTVILGAIIIVWAVAVFFLSIFACTPVSAFWTFEEMPTAKCNHTLLFYVCIWVPNIATDIVILVLPQSKIWKLHVGLKARIALAAIFLTGSLVIVASVIRFRTLFGIDKKDTTWSITTFGVWTCVELMTAVAGASMPVMRPLILKLTPASLVRALHTRTQGSNGSSSITLSKMNTNTSGFGFGKKSRNSRLGQGAEDFERLPDEVTGGKNQNVYVMGDIDTERAIIRDTKGRETST